MENGHDHHFMGMFLDDLDLKGIEIYVTMLLFNVSVYLTDIIVDNLLLFINRYIVTFVISTDYTDQTIKC